MLRIALSKPDTWDSVETRWRAMDERCDASFFQSWTWVGCLAAERYTRPSLLEVWAGGEVVGLGLFNRTRDRGSVLIW